MQQVVQNYNSGDLTLADVPAPVCQTGGVVIRTVFSLVSSGTERMKVGQARMGLVAKAKARPDKVRQVVQSVRQVGLVETYNKVRERLDALTPLGYSLAGVVTEVGAGVDEFQVGDRVACAGEGIACHAEYVFVPRNLCAAVPDNVDLKDAAFATVGAIAMNGVRQAQVTLGDSVVVIGLGLVGLLGVQILKAAGCQVIGVDLDPAKVTLAKACGADAAVLRSDDALEATIYDLTGGHGADAAYIAASTKSTDPMELAGRIVRDRGKVVIVGMVAVEADWQTYYHKELSVIMSRSYGPGRYDPNYENKGIDYPIGYVRWTERRNLEEFIRLVGQGQVRPQSLGPQVFKFDQAPEAYKQLHDGQHAVGIVFEYPELAAAGRRVELAAPSSNGRATNGRAGTGRTAKGPVVIGMIGAGNFATGTLIPALKKLPNVRLRAICSARGLTAASAGRRHGFEYCASDYKEVLADETIDAVVIATRHDTHARFAAEAMRAGKHVFVEKPLALTHEQLDEVIAAQAETGKICLPGFNRRFSPLSIAVRDHFAGRASPIEVICRVNAGEIKSDSWYQDAEEGGWRIISEGCHFVDLIQFICGCPPVSVHADMIGGHIPGKQNDNCVVTLKMEDGSLGVLIYVANGDPGYEKERIEVFGQGRAAVIENSRHAELWSGGHRTRVGTARPAKGHVEEISAFLAAAALAGASPLPLVQAVMGTYATIAICRSIASGNPSAVATSLDHRRLE